MQIVIIGGLHHNTLGVIRALGERKISPNDILLILAGKDIPRRNMLTVSKYINKNRVIFLNNDKLIISELLYFKSNFKEKPVIICCSDGSAMQVLSHKELLRFYYHIPSIDVDIGELMDKDKQTKIADSFGLNVPKSGVLSGREIGEWNTYPCITKPITSITGAGKGDINISYDKKELQKHLDNTKAEFVQVQEYLSKTLEYQLIGCSLNGGETVIIPGYTKILRQPKNTNTGYLHYAPIDELGIDIEIVNSYVKHIGYSGLFSIEFLRTQDGTDYYMEINTRNDGNGYCVTSAGVNLPYIWAYYNTMGEIPINESVIIQKTITWIPDYADFSLGIREVGFWGWINQMLKADSHSVFSKHDIFPFVYSTRLFLRSIAKNVVNKYKHT